MSNNSNGHIAKKIGYAFIWLITICGVWFAYCDKNTGEQSEYAAGDDVDKYCLYWEDVLCEYCLASEFNDVQEEYILAENQDESEEIQNTGESNQEVAEEKATKDTETEEVQAVMAMNSMNTFMQDKLADYDYIKSNFYTVDSTTNVSREELNGEILSEMDMTLDLSGDDYKILIYHTHGTESFADSEAGNVDDTVIGVGTYLAKILEEDYGIAVYHDTTVYDMKDGTLDRSAAYDYAREGVSAILEQYPSIEVVIDIHRDGVSEDTYLVTEINGKKTAQIMFLNGVSRLNINGDISYLENSNKTANMAFSLQLYLTARANYENFVRKIFIKGYRYNLDLAPRALLVEVGSQTNTVEEAKNAMEPLARILYKVLSGK